MGIVKEMEQVNYRKFTILSFLLLAALFGFLFFRGLTQILDWMKMTSVVAQAVGGFSWPIVGGGISGIAGFALFLSLSLNKKATSFFDEVFGEAQKVTWPTGKETYASTAIVVVMVVSAGLMLFLLDNIWNWFFKFLL